jgi:ATP-dependent protease HslVU (ClpYQ) peptidase subunit
LIEKLEAKLEEHPGQLLRASVELAKMWRQVGGCAVGSFLWFAMTFPRRQLV